MILMLVHIGISSILMFMLMLMSGARRENIPIQCTWATSLGIDNIGLAQTTEPISLTWSQNLEQYAVKFLQETHAQSIELGFEPYLLYTLELFEHLRQRPEIFRTSLSEHLRRSSNIFGNFGKMMQAFFGNPGTPTKAKTKISHVCLERRWQV